MLDLARRLGFTIACDLEERGCMRAALHLPPRARPRNDLHQCGNTSRTSC